jgi:hypothetical protein
MPAVLCCAVLSCDTIHRPWVTCAAWRQVWDALTDGDCGVARWACGAAGAVCGEGEAGPWCCQNCGGTATDAFINAAAGILLLVFVKPGLMASSIAVQVQCSWPYYGRALLAGRCTMLIWFQTESILWECHACIVLDIPFHLRIGNDLVTLAQFFMSNLGHLCRSMHKRAFANKLSAGAAAITPFPCCTRLKISQGRMTR